MDIFRSGPSSLKKSAVQYLGTISSPAAVKTLNRALMDEDIEVRLYAAGVLGLIDDCHAREIDMRKAQVAAHPDDPAAGLALADACVAYAETGLLDGITRAYYYRKAMGALEALPDLPRVNERFARCALALEECDEALVRIERCLAAEPANAGARRLLCEILFAQRQYGKLAQAVTEIADRRLLPANDDLLRFWT